MPQEGSNIVYYPQVHALLPLNGMGGLSESWELRRVFGAFVGTFPTNSSNFPSLLTVSVRAAR